MMKKLLYTFILTAFMTGLSFGQTVIMEQDFADGFGDWEQISVVGDQVWEIDDTHGVDDTPCAKISGHEGGAGGTDYENEDWLISPAIDFDANEDEYLNFMTAMNYTGFALELYISTDYTGNVSEANWESLSFTPSDGSWNWTASGNIDLTSYTGNGYIAFKFMSGTDGSATWEVDNISLTDGEVTPPPTGDAILEQDFADGFGNWEQISVVGDQVWEIDDIHGVDSTPCAKISGHEGGAGGTDYENEDWLISPALNLDETENETLTFDVAMNFIGPDMELLISTDYTSGDPTAANWETLSFTHPAGGNWDWNSSGEIDLSSYTGTAVFLAYKFTSTTDGSATWEVDNILLEEGEVIPPTGDIIFEDDFELGLGNWTAFSVIGDQVWDTVAGYGNPGACAKMTGHEGGSGGTDYENEDWLISPSINFDNYSGLAITFDNAMNYTGMPLQLFISNDYTEGDPNTATWEELTFTASAGNWSWVTANTALSSTGENVHVAFKFTCSSVESNTWELDNIKITGTVLGINDKYSNLFNIYPNPNQGNFYIENTSNKELLFSIFNINGKEVYSSSMNNSLIQLNLDLEAGTYFIQMKDTNSNLLGSKKIILK